MYTAAYKTKDFFTAYASAMSSALTAAKANSDAAPQYIGLLIKWTNARQTQSDATAAAATGDTFNNDAGTS